MLKRFRNKHKEKNNSKHMREGSSDNVVMEVDPPAERATQNSQHQHEPMIVMHAQAKRGKYIFAPAIDFSAGFIIPKYDKLEESIQFIDNSLADNFIFASLSETEHRLLIDAMVLETVPATTIIIQQGEVSTKDLPLHVSQK